jgi:hypothetical protein
LAADPSRQHKQRHALGHLATVFEILSLKKWHSTCQRRCYSWTIFKFSTFLWKQPKS